MKKYLSIICVLFTIMVFASCGDSNNTSDNSEVPESSITETTTEEETKPETRNINPFLDKTISCDYISLCMSSKWNPEISTYDGGASIFCEWEEESEIYDILFFINDNAKMENEDYKDYSNREILNQFISYGQEYTITKGGTEESNLVFFFNDKVNGSMSYPIDYEDIVKDIIDSIEFNDDISESSVDDVSENSVELNSDWECDYLKISTCSEWEEESKTNDNKSSVYWTWNNQSYHRISLFLDKSRSGKMSQSDLQNLYSNIIAEYQDVNSFDYNEDYKDARILDSFTENEQAYIIVEIQSDGLHNIHFSTDYVQGTFYYYSSDEEEIVRNMIKTIEFY